MGIDLGSTSLKAVVYDLEGRTVAGGSRPTERFHPDPDHPGMDRLAAGADLGRRSGGDPRGGAPGWTTRARFAPWP